MIPYGMKYTSTVSGRVPKVVDCAACNKQYVYFLERTATAEATSFLFLENEEAKQSAADEARIELLGRLARSCDPVPCPRCGLFQVHMLARAKALHRAWMLNTGLACILVVIPLLVVARIATGMAERTGSPRASTISDVALILSIGLAGIGCVMLVWRFQAARRFDPNDAPVSVRIEDGKERAMTIEEFSEFLTREKSTLTQSGESSVSV